MPIYVSSAGAIIGYGGDLLRSADGTTYTTVGKIVELDPPKFRCKDIQMTNLLSPSGAHEFRGGLRDPGEGTFKILFFATAYQTLFNALWGGLASVTSYWRAVFSDGTTTGSQLNGQGYLNGMSQPMPIDDLVLADCSFHGTGPWTFTPGS